MIEFNEDAIGGPFCKNEEEAQEYRELAIRMNNTTLKSFKKDTPQFVPLTHDRLDNQEWRIANRSRYLLYAWLRRHIRRAPSEYDKLDIYHRFYEDNKLAVSRPVRVLAKDFGYSGTRCIREWLDELFEEGAFTKEYIQVGKGQPQTVYILGEFKAGEIIWYYE